MTISDYDKCRYPECDKPIHDKGYCLEHAIEMEDWAYATYMDRLHEPPEDIIIEENKHDCE